MTERSDLIAAYRATMREIHGDLHEQDAHLLQILSDLQHEKGVVGDILEIGVYRGQTAILLGLLLDESESLHVCDRFDPPSADDPDFLEGTLDYYRPYSRDRFEETYGRFHDDLPRIYEGSSDALHGRLKPDSFRLIHVDGSHRREMVRSDIALAHSLAVDGGVIVFSAYRAPATLEVSAEVWAEVARESLIPLGATDWKLYTTQPSPEALDPEELIERTRAVGSLHVLTPEFGNSRVPVVSPAVHARVERVKRYVPPALWPLAGSLRRGIARLGRGRSNASG
jgi:hypothetical protein